MIFDRTPFAAEFEKVPSKVPWTPLEFRLVCKTWKTLLEAHPLRFWQHLVELGRLKIPDISLHPTIITFYAPEASFDLVLEHYLHYLIRFHLHKSLDEFAHKDRALDQVRNLAKKLIESNRVTKKMKLTLKCQMDFVDKCEKHKNDADDYVEYFDYYLKRIQSKYIQ